jgi:peptidoglycan DL-endopeptidase CwlO
MTRTPTSGRWAAVVCAVVAVSACAGQRPQPRVTPPVGDSGVAIVRTAESLLGAPYRDGGADPRGFDCSGYVRYVFAQHGWTLPRDVAHQWQTGREIDRAALRAGDLLFFSTGGPGATHVSIAVDRYRFIHAPSSRGVVRVESLSSPYWSRRFVGARRVVGN